MIEGVKERVTYRDDTHLKTENLFIELWMVQIGWEIHGNFIEQVKYIMYGFISNPLIYEY